MNDNKQANAEDARIQHDAVDKLKALGDSFTQATAAVQELVKLASRQYAEAAALASGSGPVPIGNRIRLRNLLRFEEMLKELQTDYGALCVNHAAAIEGQEGK